MKLFTNKTALSISDLESLTAVENFNLTNNLGKTFALKVAKFRNTSSLHVSLFILFLMTAFSLFSFFRFI